MTRTGILLVILCSLSASFSNFLLRYSSNKIITLEHNWRFIFAILKDPLFLLGVLLYGIAGIIWIQVLASEQLSIAYPFLIGLTFIIITCGAILFFHENVTINKLLGFLIILFGIFMVVRGE